MLDNTGLYFYNARYYDPAIGRFISADTIVPNPANPQSLNRYSYCYNNPLKYTDPSGHDGGFDEGNEEYTGLSCDGADYSYLHNSEIDYGNYGQDEWVNDIFDGVADGIINLGWGTVKVLVAPDVVAEEFYNSWILHPSETWKSFIQELSTTKGKSAFITEFSLGLLITKGFSKAGKFTSLKEKTPEIPKPAGRGSTIKYGYSHAPRNYDELKACDMVSSNPSDGFVIYKSIGDNRWKGWQKMQQIQNGVVVHYVYDPVTKAYDDLKIIGK